jgi:hypothetical protein
MRFEPVSGKARIAANSRTIGKIRNAAGGRFGLIDAVHELIRGSLAQTPGTSPGILPGIPSRGWALAGERIAIRLDALATLLASSAI